MALDTPTAFPRHAWVEQIMGMPISVHLRGPRVTSRQVDARVRAAFAELRKIDALFSTYRPDSEISRLNCDELTLRQCNLQVQEVALLAERARGRTDGYFDVNLPAPSGGRWFDPSGLVKGWAVERAADYFADLVDHDLCLNAGGDVLLTAGTDAPPWRVGIEHPNDRGGLFAVLAVGSGAVATSGSAHRGAHIIDPSSGTPAHAVRALSVTGPSLMWADVYATAAVARGPQAITWLDGLPGYEALIVDRHGVVNQTAGWPGKPA